MPRVVITYEYEPDLEHYPLGTKTAADAMRLDVEQIQNGNAYWGAVIAFYVLTVREADRSEAELKLLQQRYGWKT